MTPRRPPARPALVRAVEAAVWQATAGSLAPGLAVALVHNGRVAASVLAEYADHYDGDRPHRGLGQAPPLAPDQPVALAPAGRILR